MVIATGVDIVKIARFANMTAHFQSRVYTQYEQAYIAKKGPATAAGLFAAKEAVAKALGTGISGFWPTDIEITHSQQGAPVVTLHSNAALIACKLASATSLRSARRQPRGKGAALSRFSHCAGDDDFRDSRKGRFRSRYKFHLSISHTDTDAIAFAVLSKH